MQNFMTIPKMSLVRSLEVKFSSYGSIKSNGFTLLMIHIIGIIFNLRRQDESISAKIEENPSARHIPRYQYRTFLSEN